MEKMNVTSFFVIGMVSWVLGLLGGFYFNIQLLGMNSYILAIASVLFVFAFSMLFFGKFSGFALFFAGLISSNLIQQNLVFGFLGLVSFLIAGFAGSLAGFRLDQDFSGKGNFYSKNNVKQLTLYLTIALIIALIPALIQEFFPEFLTQLESTSLMLKEVIGV